MSVRTEPHISSKALRRESMDYEGPVDFASVEIPKV